ncbi:MAG: hypothetical protein K2O05_03690, partial [Anaeroplasmataceae bacterium]|nr:hypothetical protein [Anaeroplasmataceae bacterium]
DILEIVEELLNGITISNNQIEAIINIENIPQIILTIINQENGFDIELNQYDISLKIDTTKELDINIQKEEYADLNNYIDNIAYLLDIVMKKSFRLSISSKISLNEETINLEGNIDFILKNGKYQMNGSLSVSYEDMTIDLKVIMVDQKLYVQVLGQTVLLDFDTISETITTILNELNIETSETPSLDLNDFTISENRIDLGKLWIELGFKEAHIEIIDLAQIDLSITEITEYEIEVPKETITDVELLELVDYIKDVLTIVENQKVYVSFSGAYEGYQLEGVAYFEWKDRLQGKVEFNINGKEIEVYYLENNIYIGYEQIKGFISLDKVKELMSSNMEGMTLPEVDKDILEIVEELLNGITISNNQIEAIIN